MKQHIQMVIIDDSPSNLELLTMALASENVTIHTAHEPTQGIALVQQLHPDLVITDLVMPGMTGLEVLSKIVEFDPSIDVILMTAHYTAETAVEAIRNGASDYLEKPVNIRKIRDRVRQILEATAARRAAYDTHFSEPAVYTFEDFRAKSQTMWDLFKLIDKIAPHYRTVILHGPTGAGKDLAARALHARSGIRGQFVVLNCSAIVETLFESEMFGHVKGAFTGADRDKIGLFASSDGGTLFLDEIGDMPMSTQAKLLRAIQNQEVLQVGSLTPKRVNVRVIGATHYNLRELVTEGRFREDLFYRLSMIELEIPPLKERTEDILLLAKDFLRKFAAEYKKQIVGFSRKAEMVLERYAWPGNVRELEHIVGRACMLTEGSQIDICDLPSHLMQVSMPARTTDVSQSSPLVKQEVALLQKTLHETSWNQSETARRLGIGRDALRYKMKKHGL